MDNKLPQPKGKHINFKKRNVKKPTLAQSIFSVQHPEYISAPLRLSRALVADSILSNVFFAVKENIYAMKIL